MQKEHPINNTQKVMLSGPRDVKTQKPRLKYEIKYIKCIKLHKKCFKNFKNQKIWIAEVFRFFKTLKNSGFSEKFSSLLPNLSHSTSYRSAVYQSVRGT